MSKHRKKGHLPPFVPLIRTTLASPAWKQLSFGARSLYVVLRSYLRIDNLNNGKVFRSYRDAADDLGTKSRTSVQRWFRELQHYGFIAMTTGPYLGVDGEGIAAHWRITECPTFDARGNQIAATRDFDRWDGVLFVDPETESRPQNRDTPSLKQGHTDKRKQGRKRSRYPQNRDIDSDASMSPKQGHNCLPLPRLSKPSGRITLEHHYSPATGSKPRYVLSIDPSALKGYLGTFQRLPLVLRMSALGLAA